MGTLAFSALLAVTLGLKLAKPYHDGTEQYRQLTAFLAGADFHVEDTDFWTGGIPILRGQRGDCRIFLMSESSPGWTTDMIHRLANQKDRVFSVLDGRVYPRQPRWWTAISYRWSKFLRDLSLSRHPTIALAVVAQPACDAESWNWAALSRPEGGSGRSAGI